MHDDVPSKVTWVLRLNFTKKLKENFLKFHGFGLKTLAYSALLIYWGIILLGTFLL